MFVVGLLPPKENLDEYFFNTMIQIVNNIEFSIFYSMFVSWLKLRDSYFNGFKIFIYTQQNIPLYIIKRSNIILS